jgi:hypothetical protein
MGLEGPAELVQHHVMVPPAVILQVGQAGAAAIGPVHHVVRLTSRGGLIAAPRELAGLVPQRGQPPQVDRDVVGLAVVRVLYLLEGMDGTHQDTMKPQLRAATYARLSET